MCDRLNNGLLNIVMFQFLEPVNVSIYGKEDFADVRKFKDPEMGR